MAPQTRAATCRVSAPTLLDVLPLALALRIFASLPVDARLRAAGVCRSWRCMLAERALWTRLDLTPASGVRNPTNALLRAAAARAGGQLEVLHLWYNVVRSHDALLPVLVANAGSLGELVLHAPDEHRQPSADDVAALLRAAPGLRLLETGIDCDGEAALPVLRKEPPFGALSLIRADLGADVGWPAVLDGLTAHTALEGIELSTWPELQAESDAVLGALLALPRLRMVSLLSGPPASVVARLLSRPALASLGAWGDEHRGPLLDSPASIALLCDALRANTQLQELTLYNVGLWRDADAAAVLLGALQTHPSLNELHVTDNRAPRANAAAAGAALGALLAHSPALAELNLTGCHIGDAGLGPIMDALPQARSLQVLRCAYNDMSEAFARERLLPAVRACRPLRNLWAVDVGLVAPAAREAELLVRERSAR
jgi:hypothetical protein